MARLVIASHTFTDSANAVQLFSTDSPKVMAIVFKARAANVESIYVADDSAAKSSGFQLAAGDREDWSFEPATVKATNFWVWASASGDIVGYTALLEE